MGNVSSGNGARRHENHRDHPSPSPPPPPPTHPQQFVFAASTPYPTHYPNPNITPPPHTHPPSQYYQYQGYYPPFPSPYHHHNHYGANHHQTNWTPYGAMLPPAAPPVPYVEHQKAVTIRNDINLNKETFQLEPDEENPGKFLLSFTFDATVSGSITVMFFAREGEDCNLIATKEDRFPSLTVSFPKGAGQKFKQPSGTGIDFSVLSETELLEASETDVFHVAVKAEASMTSDQNASEDNPEAKIPNCQITHAGFEKDKGEHKARVIKQILWVNGKRYVLQEIYGIGDAVDDNGADGNQTEKECVICLSEPRDTTVLPCRHMCICSGCAKLLRFQTNRCPICRQPVERLLEITVNTDGANQ